MKGKFSGENAFRDEGVTASRDFFSTKSKTEPKPSLVMKPIIPFALLGALLTVGAVNAASTTPVGYVSQTLAQGFNVVGLNLSPSSVATGNFETVAGTTLTDTGVTFSVTAGRLYVLEITSGTLKGTIQEIPAASISGSNITTPDNLQTAGLLAGDTYNLRLAPTLEEVFTTTPLASGGVLQAGISSTGADVIWVPTASGTTFTKYYLSTQGGIQFRLAGTTTPALNVPLVYSDGIYIEKKGATTATLTVTGEVKKVGTNSVIVQGFNVVSVVAPVGLNLFNAGLADDLTAGISPTGADIVWVQQANLSYLKYFRSGSNWRAVAAPTVNLTQAQAEAVTLPSAILIEKKGATAVTLDLDVPATYSSL